MNIAVKTIAAGMRRSSIFLPPFCINFIITFVSKLGERKMKKRYTKLDKLQVVFAVSAAISALIATVSETYQWMFKLVHILIAFNLIALGFQRLREKRSFSSYFIIGLAALIIVLSLS